MEELRLGDGTSAAHGEIDNTFCALGSISLVCFQYIDYGKPACEICERRRYTSKLCGRGRYICKLWTR